MAYILVVEDEPVLRMILAELFQDEGHEVCLADGVAQGKVALADRVPDLVVLDLLMPGGMGSDLVAAMRAETRTSGVPAVVITGLSAPQQFLPAGSYQAALSKPFNLEELLDVVNGLLPGGAS